MWKFVTKWKHFFNPIGEGEAYPNEKLMPFATQEILLNEGVRPFRMRQYPVSQAKRTILMEIIRKQLEKNMIRVSSSPFASSAFLVPKSNGKSRLVVDFRKLNSSIQHHSWPIPVMSHIIDKLGGNSHFSSMDLVDGFHQCPLAENSKKYTAFITEAGLYEYNVTPMGLKTSPNHFQYMVDSVLSGTATLALRDQTA